MAAGYTNNAYQTPEKTYEVVWVTKLTGIDDDIDVVKSHSQDLTVHVTFDASEDICGWRRKHPPTRQEWISYGNTEMQDDILPLFAEGWPYSHPIDDGSRGTDYPSSSVLTK